MVSFKKAVNILTFIVAVPCFCEARVGAALAGFYWADSFTPTSTESSQSRYNYSFDLQWNFEKVKWLAVGVGILGLGESFQNGRESRNFSTQDYGLLVSAYLDRKRALSFTFIYNPVASGVFEETAAKEKFWSGSSLVLRGSYAFEFNRRFQIGVHLSHYAADYTSEQQERVTRSISAQRTVLSPSTSLIYWF